MKLWHLGLGAAFLAGVIFLQETGHPSATALEEAGIKAFNRGDYPEADRLLSECERSAGPTDVAIAISCMEIEGQLLLIRGRHTEAEALLLRALSKGENIYGLEVPLGRVHAELANVYIRASRLPEAEAAATRAVELLRGAVSTRERSSLAGSLLILGRLRYERGQDAQAEGPLMESLALFEQVEGPQGGNVASASTDLGIVRLHQGRLDEAQALLQKAMAIYEPTADAGHPFGGIARLTVARIALQQGKEDVALEEYRRAVESMERDFGPDSKHLATGLVDLGSLLSKRGELEEAERALRHAATIFQANPTGRTMDGARGLNQLAVLLWDQRRYAEALPFVQASVEILEALPEVDPKDLATAAIFAGRAQAESGDTQKAEASYRKALAIREKLYAPGSPELNNVIVPLEALLTAQGRKAEAEALRSRAGAATGGQAESVP